ncbi:BlaI/MecI/CopY family transcriptional regulator [Sphingobacterium paramultivorum]|uniref:BlaI/MecI/CopY family transcriptional regulator n=1 Tax=Sphingobacterium paramultivorum TaxID=2886510 RepID=A0A7G5E5F6_9SPHI|nr:MULTISPECIES: BlaI/MecI/CopY family transcriptional regulator [Sphingobacterium]MCS4166850.1 putative transcriptional regulator [Sphingobacterium sp. BIGb0116]QMV69231.1 BlaI/MecI/CopY family transcriptional regulator [Sphingobacterium paramultivorum]WSO13023.1 BlaI/MecI/CopY family transcriptional regulator [Sphingobacterium paramultivorum]
MEELTKKEEEVMQVIWKLNEVFVKDIIEYLDPSSSIPYNTISSIVRILEKKGYVGYRAFGKTYQYYPLISKMQYRKFSFSRVLDHYFDDSVENLLSFMVKEKKLSAEDIQKIEQLIKKHEDHE